MREGQKRAPNSQNGIGNKDLIHAPDSDYAYFQQKVSIGSFRKYFQNLTKKNLKFNQNVSLVTMAIARAEELYYDL